MNKNLLNLLGNLGMTVVISAFALNVAAADKKTAKKAGKKEETVAATVFKIDTKESKIEWTGSKNIGGSHNGEIKLKAGELTVEKDLVKSGSFEADMATITNLDLKDETFNKKLVGHLSSEDFFNIAKYPTSKFVVKSVTAGKAKGEMTIKGDLTMLDKTVEVEVPATMKIENNKATGEAKMKLDRTNWGLKYGSGNFFKELAADKVIKDEFELTLKLVATK